MLRHGFALEEVLPLVTTKTAAVLKLAAKGRLERGCDGDVAVLEKDSLTPRHVVARGGIMMRDGRAAVRASWMRGAPGDPPECHRRSLKAAS